jgi:ABC-type glycerol-3-phosphate transport system substrate-binding protein
MGMKFERLLIVLASAAALAACSDNPAADTPQPPVVDDTRVPASALVSARAFSSFAASLAPSDSKLPLEVNGVTPPTSETEEPQTL